MGQNFDIMNFDKKLYMQIEAMAANINNLYNDKDYNIAIANLIYDEWKGDRIAIVGDYAGGYEKACSKTAFKFIRSICDKYDFDKYHVQGWIDDMIDKSEYTTAEDYSEAMDDIEIEGNINNIHNLRYAYNHKLKQYVDFDKYSIKNWSCVASPLVMLLTIGMADERAGCWADTSEFITIEKEKLNNDYKEITYWIDDGPVYDSYEEIYGCIIGGAVGDALGYPVEFLNEKEIFDKYGKGGIKEFELSNGEALISDDTQMTMFTITAMLCCEKMFDLNSDGSWPPTQAYYHYRDWYKTQTKSYADYSKFDKTYSWLMKEKRMYVERAQGFTCISALASNNKCSIDNPINSSKGCGGLMRVAPVGLIYAYNEDEEIAICGAELAALTHGHPLGYIPAAFLSLFIAKLYIGMNLENAYKHTYKVIKDMYGSIPEFRVLEELLQKAIELGNKRTKPINAIHELGKGFVAEEALAIAIYCSFRFRDNFKDAICAAVNHSGDSDSTGSITGQIMGAYLGFDKIPEYYKKNLELKDILYELCDDIYNGCPYDKSDELRIKRWESRYVSI